MLAQEKIIVECDEKGETADVLCLPVVVICIGVKGENV